MCVRRGFSRKVVNKGIVLICPFGESTERSLAADVPTTHTLLFSYYSLFLDVFVFLLVLHLCSAAL